MAHSYANFRFNSSLGTCSVSGNTYWLVNSLTILVVLPILNQFVFPCLREYTPSLLKRIGIGYILSAASLLILMILIHAGQEVSNDCLFSQKKYQETLRLSSWLLLVPLILISLSEVFVNLSSENNQYIFLVVSHVQCTHPHVASFHDCDAWGLTIHVASSSLSLPF